MKIRKAEKKDYQELMNFYNYFVGQDRYSKLDNDSYNYVLANTSNYAYVAEDEGVLIGFATFSVRDVIRYPKLIAELDELFVSFEYRKKGVGKKLMQQVKQQAKNLNCYRMFIESHYNHKAAHSFYKSLGYTNYGYHFIKNL